MQNIVKRLLQFYFSILPHNIYGHLKSHYYTIDSLNPIVFKQNNPISINYICSATTYDNIVSSFLCYPTTYMDI